MNQTLKYIKGSPEVQDFYFTGDPTDRDFGMVLMQPGRPVAAGELNMVQQSANANVRNALRRLLGTAPVLLGGPLATASGGVADQIRLHTTDVPFTVAFDGLVKTVFAYDQGSSPTRGGNRVNLPAWTVSGRNDLVYMEVWFEEIQAGTSAGTASEVVYDHGMVGNFTLPNDLRISQIDLNETTRRVQMRAQIKSIAGVTFDTSPGVLDGVLARGATGYGFSGESATGGDAQLFTAGDGSAAAAQALGSVDGYVYGIPLINARRGTTSTSTSVSAILPMQQSTTEIQADLTSALSRISVVETTGYRFLSRTRFVTVGSGTYPRSIWEDLGARAIKATIIGGGGGGGGAPLPGAGEGSVGGGGGAGGALTIFIPVSQLPASIPYTVGAGGAEGVGSTSTLPTAGSDSVFNGHTGRGGAAGTHLVAAGPGVSLGGDGGTSDPDSVGTSWSWYQRFNGSPGQPGLIIAVSPAVTLPGEGGRVNGPWSMPYEEAVVPNSFPSLTPGTNEIYYGNGGRAGSSNGATAKSGEWGMNGAIFVEVYA